MTKTKSILTDIFDAWRAQDIEWLGSYLPDDFYHMVHVPTEIHPLGGLRRGKSAALQRWTTVAQEFDRLRFDTSGLMLQNNRAGLEIPSTYRHKATGFQIETTIANFWTFEDGWPVKLAEYYDIERVQAFTAKLAALTPLSRA